MKRSVYEINTRVWIHELSALEGRPLTLADVPQTEIERIADLPVDFVWLMGVWRGSPGGVAIARSHGGLLEEYGRVLPDWVPEDVIGSPYAVAEYSVDPLLGGTKGLAVIRDRLARRGIGLILDFVPNHTARDHAWISTRPDLFVNGRPEDVAREPGNWFEAETFSGRRVIAHGRDPNFPGWTDTAQVDYRNSAAREALSNVLAAICGLCDGVRCDMAMLPLNDVFARTWGPRRDASGAPLPGPQDEFWPGAIAAVRSAHPRFIFMAEAYWGLEGRLQELGFDYTYDKGLYDALVANDAGGVVAHLDGDVAAQSRRVRFIENHDERRAAEAFSWERHQAAAVLTATVPGMTLYHEGQFEGRKTRLPVQLRRRPRESLDPRVRPFYETLLRAASKPPFRAGAWRLLRAREAWPGSHWRGCIAQSWNAGAEGRAIVVVNLCDQRGQFFVEVGSGFAGEGTVELRDLLTGARFLRDAKELGREGLYADLPPHGTMMLELLRHSA